ncbi:hypothetical protein [Microbacterium lacticum]
MPTFSDPATYAAEAARNLRALAGADQLTEAGAHATIADLRDATAAMRLVLDRLAAAHTIPGHPTALRAAALQTGDELHQAGTALDEARGRLAGAVRAADEMTRIDSAEAPAAGGTTRGRGWGL